MSCVLRAMRAEKSVGSAIASSSALVCSDCVPPCVAASASMHVRVTLLNGSCAVRLQPLVWQCVRSASDLTSFGANSLLDQLRPQQARRPHLGDLHEVVHADRPEEREPRRERVDVEAGAHAGAHVFDAVGDGVGQLQVRRRPGLLHVVAGDRDRVELRHLRAGEGEDVGDDAHRGIGRIDVGVAHHELFEDVVLDGARELLGRHALLLARHDVQRQHGQHRAVHGHRHRHVGEVDAVEQRAHVVDAVDRHARHADVAAHARMIAVVAAVRGEIERHRQPLLPGRDVAPIEGVGILRRREPRVLAHGPRLRHVHRRIRPAQVGRDARDSRRGNRGPPCRLPCRAA